MPLTPEQIAQMDADLGQGQPQGNAAMIAEMDAALGVQPQQDGGFLSNVGQDIGEAAQEALKIQDRYQSGDIGAPSAIWQGATNVGANLIGDVAFEGLKSGWESLVPENVKRGLGTMAQPLIPPEQLQEIGLSALQKGGQAWSEFEEAHPEAADNLRGAVNALNVVGAGQGLKQASRALPTVSGAGRVLAKEVVAPATKAAASGVSAPLKGAVKMAAPKLDVDLVKVGRLAEKYNIPTSIDQLTQSKAVKAAQKFSQDIPFSGQEVFRGEQMAAFNKAIFKTVGQKFDKFTPESMKSTYKAIGSKFDDIGKGKVFDTAPITSSIDDFKGAMSYDDAVAAGIDPKDIPAPRYEALTEAGKEKFDKIIAGLMDELKGGEIPGEKLNYLRSKYNHLSRAAKDSEVSEIFKDVENFIIEGFTSADPALAKKLTEAKRQYKNFLVIEPLANKAKGGDFSPTLLGNRVERIYGRQHTLGNSGELGELSRVGRELLPELGGSDTQMRLLVERGMQAAATGGFLNPSTTIQTILALGGNRMLQMVNRSKWARKALMADAEFRALSPKKANKLLDILSKGKKKTLGE